MTDDLSQFDANFCPRGTPPRECRIYNGLYTLTFPDGSHRTFRIHTKRGRSSLAGKRIISLLTRADNEDEDSYQTFGFVDDHGIKPWKSCKPGWQYANIIWRLATGEAIEGHELLVSRRCLVCNRTLTDPESIAVGVGPSCRKKNT